VSSRRVLLVVGCAVCLLVLTSALPAADPRLDAPSVGDGNGTIAGSWDSVDDAQDGTETGPTDDDEGDSRNDEGDDGSEDDRDDIVDRRDSAELEIDGPVEAGGEVTVWVDDGDVFHHEYPVQVDGQLEGEAGSDGLSVTVPYAEEMRVQVPELSLSATIDVETAATIETVDPVAQNRNVTVAATVGSTPVPNATVVRDGTPIGTTDADGEATVRMPERVGTTELGIDRGPVAGNATLELPAPRVEVVSPLLLPGAPAPVQVTADGVAVPDAQVSAVGGGNATTGGDGTARVRLPIDDRATIVTEVDGERATTTVGNLYLRLTVVGVLLPGLVVGGVWTYLRFVSGRKRFPVFGRSRVSLSALFVGFADRLTTVLDALRRPSVPDLSLSTSPGWLSGAFRWPSLSWPSPSLPRPSVPSIGPVFSGLFGSEGGSLRTRLGFGGDGEDSEDGSDAAGPSLADRPLGPPAPSRELRALWHAFLDRLDVRRRETRTPGQVARRALAAGFPASQVRRLLGVFREVEYGGSEPSSERVAEARAATEELLDDETDEEGSE